MNEALITLFNSILYLEKTLDYTYTFSYINLYTLREFHPIAWFMIVFLICICILLFVILYRMNKNHQRHIKQMKTEFNDQINLLKRQFFLDEENGSAMKLKTYVKKENEVEEIKGQHGKAASDEKLLKNAIIYVNDNLENPNLSVEEMSRKLGLSRTHLHRKLKQLTGQTPIDFIKTLRLKYASKLLETGKMSVSEVSYKVGYNTPSYFSSSFNNHFGMSPTHFMEQAIQQNKEALANQQEKENLIKKETSPETNEEIQPASEPEHIVRIENE